MPSPVAVFFSRLIFPSSIPLSPTDWLIKAYNRTGAWKFAGEWRSGAVHSLEVKLLQSPESLSLVPP